MPRAGQASRGHRADDAAWPPGAPAHAPALAECPQTFRTSFPKSAAPSTRRRRECSSPVRLSRPPPPARHVVCLPWSGADAFCGARGRGAKQTFWNAVGSCASTVGGQRCRRMYAESRRTGTIVAKMRMERNNEHSGSAQCQPKLRISRAEMMTATEPIVSASTCRNMPCISGFWRGPGSRGARGHGTRAHGHASA